MRLQVSAPARAGSRSFCRLALHQPGEGDMNQPVQSQVGRRRGELPSFLGRWSPPPPLHPSKLKLSIRREGRSDGVISLFTVGSVRRAVIKRLFTLISPSWVCPSSSCNNCSNYQPSQSVLWRDGPPDKGWSGLRATRHICSSKPCS